MRIALLSTLNHDINAGGPRPAFAPFAGSMVAERQLDLALKMGCERVIALVDSVEREVVELQHHAESLGVKFRTMKVGESLAGLAAADDELLVVASGLLPDDALVERILTSKKVLALPAELAVPLGYERIDLEMAWAGIMLLPGHLAERLGDLPEDVDVHSALMRLGLQSGVRAEMLDRTVLSDGRWHLNADRKALEIREKNWIDAQRRQIAFTAPGLAVAERAGARLARDVVGQAAQPVPLAAALVAVIGSGFAGFFGHTSVALALASLAALFGHMGGLVERVAKLGRPKVRTNPIQSLLNQIIDPLFIALLILAAPEQLGWMRFFAPLMLFGLLRLGERYGSEKWRATYSDRITLGFLLAPAAFAGFAVEATAIIALLVLATRFFEGFRAD